MITVWVWKRNGSCYTRECATPQEAREYRDRMELRGCDTYLAAPVARGAAPKVDRYTEMARLAGVS